MDNEGETARYLKPLPEPGPVTQPFWDAAREHRLLLQRSRRTGKWVFYPRAVSPFGIGDTLDWATATGRGRVYSFTVARRATAPQWDGDVPYVIAIIELDEGVRMTGNVVECDPETVRVGMTVEAVYADVTPEVTLVQWRPARFEPAAPVPVPAPVAGPVEEPAAEGTPEVFS